jgi:hypothetical protein
LHENAVAPSTLWENLASMDLNHPYAFRVMLVLAVALAFATAVIFVSFHAGGHHVSAAQLLHEAAAHPRTP